MSIGRGDDFAVHRRRGAIDVRLGIAVKLHIAGNVEAGRRHFAVGNSLGQHGRCADGGHFILFGSNYQDVFAFLVLILVLVFRPQGLLGERVGDRA